MRTLRQKRDCHSVFPAPPDGETVGLNPPALQWVAEPDCDAYQLTVTDADGGLIVERQVEANWYCFPFRLEPGVYEWDLKAGRAARGKWRFTVPEDAVDFLPPRAEELLEKLPDTRPRHLYFPEDVAGLAAKYSTELDILERNAQLAYADGLMEYPDFYRAGGRTDYRTALDEVRRFLDRDAVACALLWMFRRDMRAGAFAKSALLRICEWNPAGPASVAGPWGDEIGLSICRVMPALFDWTGDLLDEKERRWAADTLLAHARQCYEVLHGRDFFAQPGYSHSGRLPGYLGEAALVLYGELSAETDRELAGYLQYALDLYGSIFPHYGCPDGGWAEGAFYASSYTKWYLPFLLAVERLSGFSFLNKPFYRHAAEFFTHFAAPGMEVHPFGDGHWETRAEWPGFQAQDPFGIYAERFGPPLAREFSRRCREEIEHYELHLLDVIRPEPPEEGITEGGKSGETSDETSIRGRIGSDLCYVSQGAGLAAMHTDLADPEHDIAVFCRCSRFGTPSHQHADQGNFAILAGGQGLIVPSGSFGYQYGDAHHRAWTQQTVAANCVLIDGVGQPKHSAEAVGLLEVEPERDGVTRLLMRLERAYPMLKQYQRILEFNHRNGELTVTDMIESPKAVALDWRLHSYAAPELSGDRYVVKRPNGLVRFQLHGPAYEYSCGDRYCYPNGAEEESAPHRERAPQYHMNWRFAPARQFTVQAVFHIFIT